MKKFIIIAICFLFSAKILQAQPYWQVVSKKMPFPVSGGQAVHDLSKINTKIYILGGYSDSLQSTVDWIQEFDAQANTWKIAGKMLQPRKQFVAGIWNGKVIYFGGVDDTSKVKNSIEIWDPSGKDAPSVYDTKTEFGRSYFTGHVIGDMLYIIGGSPYAGGKISYIASYNLSTKQVSIQHDVASVDKPRDQMTFIINDYIYLFGGAVNGVNDRIQRFNIPLQRNESLQDRLLEKRAGGSAVYVPQLKRGFLIGGYNESTTAMSSVEVASTNFDGSLKIERFVPINYARYNSMAVNYLGVFVAVFGGKDSKGKVVPYVELLQSFVGVSDEKTPTEFMLEQNYPNPFNPSTAISYKVQTASYVTLKVYDALGNQIVTLVDEYKQVGNYKVTLNVKTPYMASLPSGVYFYRLTAHNQNNSSDQIFSSTKKMILMK